MTNTYTNLKHKKDKTKRRREGQRPSGPTPANQASSGRARSSPGADSVVSHRQHQWTGTHKSSQPATSPTSRIDAPGIRPQSPPGGPEHKADLRGHQYYRCFTVKTPEASIERYLKCWSLFKEEKTI